MPLSLKAFASWTRQPAAVLLGLLFGVLAASSPAYAATITVTNATDVIAGGDGCSLREALANANSNNTSGSAECTAGSGSDTIEFNLQNGVNGVVGAGPYTIELAGSLAVGDSTTINGFSQPGASANTNTVSAGSNAVMMIEIDGEAANDTCFYAGANTTLRGLVINRCVGGPISILLQGDGVTIAGNYIGTNSAGTAVTTNASSGVYTNGSHNAVIGGVAAADRNVIAGHAINIRIIAGSAGSTVQGTYIGVNAAGTSAFLANEGIGINVNGSPNTQIGSTNVEGRNVISGVQIPISIEHAASTGSRIEGNYFGTNAAGAAMLGNDGGIVVSNSVPNLIIGGTVAGARNVIAGSSVDGIYVDGSATTGPTIQGNYIGTNAAGDTAFPNVNGIHLFGGVPGATIGGTLAGAGNLISGNTDNGILVEGAASPGTTIHGNIIGMNAAASAALPNGVGINTQNGGNNLTVGGGTTVGAANIIAFNTGIGVRIASNSTGNSIRGNSIYSNGGLGIDLAPAGVRANDPDDPDTGANNYQNFPVLTSAMPTGGTTRISGAIDSTASTAFTVDFYSSPSCDASGNGEGRTYLGSSSQSTNASGDRSFLITGAPAVTAGDVVTATLTDPSGNTSEFSACVTAATAAVSVTESGGSTTTVENGATDTLSVVLTGSPTSDVTVVLSSSATGLVTFSPSATLTFTTADWNVPQVVTVASVNDQVVRASLYSINVAVSSGDSVYNGISVASISATHTENDTAGFVVAPTSGLVTTEAGGTAQFTVRLSSIPINTVTIAVSSSDGAEGVASPNSLTFAANGTALTDQTVTVTGQDDLVLDGNIAYTVILGAATSADTFYSGVNPTDVSLTNTDNEVATATPTVTPTITPTPTATPTVTSTLTPTQTWTPTVTATTLATATVAATVTPTVPAARPSVDDSDKRPKQTEEQRLNEDHTNTGNRDDVHTEGNVQTVEVSADGGSLLVTIALGAGGRETVIVQIPCGAARCPDIQSGDYLQADGYQNGTGDPNDYFVASDDISVTRNGQRIR